MLCKISYRLVEYIYICIYVCIYIYIHTHIYMKTLFCFPGGSAGKESASNMGDLGFIPGLGRYPGEGNGNPL